MKNYKNLQKCENKKGEKLEKKIIKNKLKM